MKIGDFLICNDCKTKVEIVGFDQTTIRVKYNGKIYSRPRSVIGKTLHYVYVCKKCLSNVSPLFCERCDSCGYHICNNCHTGHRYECRYSRQNRRQNQGHIRYDPNSDYNYSKYEDHKYYNDEKDNSYDYGYGNGDGPTDNYDYYYNPDYDGDDI